LDCGFSLSSAEGGTFFWASQAGRSPARAPRSGAGGGGAPAPANFAPLLGERGPLGLPGGPNGAKNGLLWPALFWSLLPHLTTIPLSAPPFLLYPPPPLVSCRLLRICPRLPATATTTTDLLALAGTRHGRCMRGSAGGAAHLPSTDSYFIFALSARLSTPAPTGRRDTAIQEELRRCDVAMTNRRALLI
jgi:hypothetical protein